MIGGILIESSFDYCRNTYQLDILLTVSGCEQSYDTNLFNLPTTYETNTQIPPQVDSHSNLIYNVNYNTDTTSLYTIQAESWHSLT